MPPFIRLTSWIFVLRARWCNFLQNLLKSILKLRTARQGCQIRQYSLTSFGTRKNSSDLLTKLQLYQIKFNLTWHLKALEPELNRLEKALEDEAQRNETALNQAGLQRHLIHVWYRFSTWQSRNSTQKLTAIKVWSHFNSTLLRQKKLKTWCLLRCVIWKHLLEKSKESWRRTNPQNKQMSSMAYGHVTIMLRRAAQFETQKADVFWTQEVALSGDCITFPTTWRWTYWGKNQSGARRGWAFCLPCRDKPLKYQLHVSRQRAKKSKNKRNRWQSDWDNVLHRSNSSLPVWELSFAPSEQLSTIHISHMPPVTIGAEMLKQHNCVIGFWLSSSPW